MIVKEMNSGEDINWKKKKRLKYRFEGNHRI